MQITILVHITYKVNVEYDVAYLQSFQVLKEVHYYISDDKTHDSLFVQHIFTIDWGYMKNKGCFPKQHLVWSDGCLQNSNVLEHGTLWPIIHDLLFLTKDYKVSKCARIILPSIMVNARLMGQVPF
jgi:hypothetical protein